MVSAAITSGAQAREANRRGQSFSAADSTGSPKDEGRGNERQIEFPLSASRRGGQGVRPTSAERGQGEKDRRSPRAWPGPG